MAKRALVEVVEMQEVLLDVDTGVDDALAIVFATAHPQLNVRAITCVGGNVELAQVVRNTLKTLDVAGAPEIGVAAGASHPLLEDPIGASFVHGKDGLADLDLPESARTASPLTAMELARDRILDSPVPVTLVALGPLTNAALLLRGFPHVRENISRIVFMGGSAGGGNATAVAEFNIWHDPEAAAIVLGSGVPISMYGLDVFERVIVDEPIAHALQTSGSPRHRFVGDLLQHRMVLPSGGLAEYRGLLGDAGAVCAVADQRLIRWEQLSVHVELMGQSRGQTLVDRRVFPGEGDVQGSRPAWTTVDVAMGVDSNRACRLFLDTIEFDATDRTCGLQPGSPRGMP